MRHNVHAEVICGLRHGSTMSRADSEEFDFTYASAIYYDDVASHYVMKA
ncbi:MAG: hypothetical protein ACHQ03_09250 [Candidatus Bathyarchaeia archaeon]